jgi:hypothetical protein
MKSMNDTAQQTPIYSSNSQPQGSIGVAKEAEPVVETIHPEVSSLSEIGQEIELTPDVSASGVSVHPTVIQIPKPVQAQGVKPVGQNVPLGTGATITLPLTDDQIVVGLKQSPMSSWRFLALWCKRQLQQIGRAIRIIGGKAVEVETR